ncbi:MAG: AbrB/MazE/SpoVT family DNA-binding domain-containing protein [Spirulinaceae cyanobacterium]
MKLKVTAVGNSVGIIFSEELLEKLCISQGDTLYVTQTPRGVELSLYDEEFATQMEIAELIMREDSDVLHKLAQ